VGVLAIVSLVAVSAPFASANTLYGMAENATLITIDPTTGVQKEVGKIPQPKEAQAQALATMDRTNGIFYLMGQNTSSGASNLLGYSIKTGKIVSSVKVPFEEPFFVGVGQAIEFDINNQQIVAFGVLPSDNLPHVEMINPTTGVGKQILTVTQTGLLDMLGGFTAFDPKYNILWINYGYNSSGSILDQYFGFNVATGKLAFRFNNTDMISALDWDPVNNRTVGIGYTGKGRTLLTLDGATGKVTVVAKVPGWSMMSSSISAYDPATQTIYAILQPTGAPTTSPFHIVGMSFPTGKVVSSAVLCANDAVCPWSLEVQYS